MYKKGTVPSSDLSLPLYRRRKGHNRAIGDTAAALFSSLEMDSLAKQNRSTTYIKPTKMTLSQWNTMAFKQQLEYLEQAVPGLTLEDAQHARRNFTMRLISKLAPENQWSHIHEKGLMTNDRCLADILQIPYMQDILESLPDNAIVADIGGGEGNGIDKIAEIFENTGIQTYNVDKNIPHRDSQSIFLQHNISGGLPTELPDNCNLIYSNRVVQYVDTIDVVLKDIYNHLASGAQAVVHLGRGHSFTPAALQALESSMQQQGHSLKIIAERVGSDKENPLMYAIYLCMKKTDKPLNLPEFDSELPKGNIMRGKSPLKRGELYYNRKLVSEKEYALGEAK